MEFYFLVRFAHFVGFTLLGGGLLAVFISEARACQTRDVRVFVEATRFTALFYDVLALPGAVLVAVSGGFLIVDRGRVLFDEPWLMGMVGLFLLVFLGGNVFARLRFRRTLRDSTKLLENERVFENARAEVRTFMGQVAHFLNLPLFSVIVYCGVVRPDNWAQVILAITAAVSLAGILVMMVPGAQPQARPRLAVEK